jgi:indole-3-acetate monooxygenase
VQAAIGRATTLVAAARTLLLTTAGELDAVVAAGGEVTDELRGRYRGAICHIAEVAREVLVTVHDLGGSGPIFTGNRLGHLFADGMAAAQHMNVAPWQFEVVGRTHLGLPAGTPRRSQASLAAAGSVRWLTDRNVQELVSGPGSSAGRAGDANLAS